MQNKKIIMIVAAVFLVIAAVVVFFLLRSGGEEETSVDGPSDIIGYVLKLEDDSFLVAEGLEGESPYDGDIERLEGEAIDLQVLEDTEFLNQDGDEVDFFDLEDGMEVEVWTSGIVSESYPGQAEALKVQITGEEMEVTEEEEEPEDELVCDDDNSARMEVIESLENVWGDLEPNIPERPELGSSKWHTPYHVQFIGDDSVMIAFEDGHSVSASVVDYECGESGATGFQIAETDTLYDFPLEEDVWSDLRGEYGDESRTPNNYTSIPVYAEGEMIEVEDWQEIEPNIFILDEGGGHKL
ncbi:MAG: DUF3221 domain-containing protein [Candidatus Paceibacterota bacterium]